MLRLYLNNQVGDVKTVFNYEYLFSLLDKSHDSSSSQLKINGIELTFTTWRTNIEPLTIYFFIQLNIFFCW